MTEHVVVEWGDKSGGGFVPYTDPRRGAPPGPAFVKVAHDMQDDVVHQPPDDARDNDRFPVWGLQQVDVEDHGPHWCFTVQGRGGTFGRAGSCQYLFVPAGADPAEVWAYGVALVGPDGRLGHEPHGVVSAVDSERLVGPLTALAQRRRRIALAGDPAEVAAVIGSLVRVLPSAVVAEHIWMTYPMTPPVMDKRPSVTGQWPAEQADSQSARGVARWLESDPDEVPETLPPRAEEAIRWLAHLAADGRRDHRHRDQPSLRALLDLVIAEELGITEADIGRLVQAHDPRLRDGTNPEMVRRWASRQSDAAIGALLRNPPSWLEAMLFEGVLQAQLLAENGRNPARFPPAQAPARWHDRIADLLRARYQNRAELVRFVRDHVTGPGKPLGSADLVHHHRKWLERVGISSTDPSTGIFPVPVKEIAASLGQSGRILPVHQEFLRAAPDPVEAIRSVVGRMSEMTAPAAAVLMAVPEDEADMCRVLRMLLKQTGSRVNVSDWLDQVVRAATSERVKDAVITVGIEHLGKQPGQLPDAFLASVLEVWGPRETPPVGRVLRDAAARLRTGPRKVESAPAWATAEPRSDDRWGVSVEPARTSAAFSTPEEQPEPGFDESQESSWAVAVAVVAMVVIVLFLVVGGLMSRLGVS